MKTRLILLLLLGFYGGFALAQSDMPGAHDPVMIEQDNTYYVFATGKGISVWSSPDMKSWNLEPSVFSVAPAWTSELVRDFDNVEWAPDISLHNGRYYLYYSVSQFGRNNSAIGVATNETLHPADPKFKWVDHGPVIQSVPGRDMWNAIDPNLAFDDEGTPWLAFGSFWMGIKLVKLDSGLTNIAREPEVWHTIAARHRYWKLDERDAGDSANPELDYDKLYPKDILEANRNMQSGAIEAAFIFKKNGYYYLFVSWDRCCRGTKSTYKIMVGRSRDITGPYLDKEDTPMIHGGGSLIAKGNQAWAAVGHEAAYTFDGTDFLICHGYDNADQGKPKLIIRKITWEDGWPKISL